MTAAAQALVEIEPSRVPTRMQEPATIPLAEMTPVQMAYQLIQSGANFESVKEMLALSKELAADTAKRAFDEAVAAAKAAIPTIAKNAKGHNEKRYANFAAYAAVVDPILGAHGLNYRFRTEQADKITVTCILSHKGGHSEENRLSGPADSSGSKNAIQAIGSTLTYLQRYTLIQALGLAAGEDDDGGKAEQTVDDIPINADQAAHIRSLIEQTGTDIAKFCNYLKIEAIPDLLTSQYPRAVQSLEKKRGAK
jgi:hypothetical protein